jgi:hypothetical protein
MAEREGFEPSEPVRVHLISNQAHSATLSSLQTFFIIGKQSRLSPAVHLIYSGLPALHPCGASSRCSLFKFVPDKFVESSTFGHSVISPEFRLQELGARNQVPGTGISQLLLPGS